MRVVFRLVEHKADARFEPVDLLLFVLRATPAPLFPLLILLELDVHGIVVHFQARKMLEIVTLLRLFVVQVDLKFLCLQILRLRLLHNFFSRHFFTFLSLLKFLKLGLQFLLLSNELLITFYLFVDGFFVNKLF